MATLIQPSKFHFVIDGTALVKARERAGFETQGPFAEKCGWTQQHQSQLELPGEHEIGLETAEALERVLSTPKGG